MVTKNLLVRGGADFSSLTKSLKKVNKDLDGFGQTTRRSLSGANQNIRTTQKRMQSFGAESKDVFKNMLSQKGIPAIGNALQGLTRSIPVVGSLTAGLAGMGGALGGVSAALGPVGVAIAAVTVAIGAGVAIIGAASQQAVRYESSINRLSLALGAGTQAYLDWGKAQGRALGLSEQAVADIGATQGMLLSSFIPDKRQLSQATQEMVKAITVIASNSGRNVQDVAERIRSGMLGSTEAIEDLGIYINVSMIESTEAFRRFAGDKSWQQLDFKTQQLIRQQAILEQASSKYGNELAGNTSSAQARLVAGLQDIQLNLSRAFKPIWDEILPALESLVNGLVTVTENIARFVHWMKGIPYNPTIRNTEETSQAVGDLAEGYDDVTNAVKKATLGVAGFDEVNQLNWQSGSESTATSGAKGTGLSSANPFPAIDKSLQEPIQIPGIVFGPPTPPDMGMGPPAALAMQIVNSLPPGLAIPLGLVTGQWTTMLNGLMSSLSSAKTSIDEKWDGLKTKISSINTSTTGASSAWSLMLSSMLGALNGFKPLIETSWDGLKTSVNSIKTTFNSVKTSWSQTLTDMLNTIKSKASSIITEIGKMASSFADMVKDFAKPITIPAPKVTEPKSSSPSYGQSMTNSIKQTFDPKTLGEGFAKTFSAPFLQSMGQTIVDEANKPQNKIGLAVMSTLAPIAKVGGTVAKAAGPVINAVKNAFGGLGKAVPAFATGGIVGANSPMLAMVGDNRTQREAIAPVDDLMTMISSAVLAAMNAQGNRTGDIVLNIDGVSFARVTNPYQAKEATRIGANMITVS